MAVEQIVNTNQMAQYKFDWKLQTCAPTSVELISSQVPVLCAVFIILSEGDGHVEPNPKYCKLNLSMLIFIYADFFPTDVSEMRNCILEIRLKSCNCGWCVIIFCF